MKIVDVTIENDSRQDIVVLDGSIRLGAGALVAAGTQFEPPIYISDNARILRDVSVGKYSYVGRGSIVTRAHIGRYCSIAHDCRINYFREHPQNWLSTHPFQYDSGNFAFWNGYRAFAKRPFDANQSQARIIIEHDVWIGAGAMLFGGVTISTGAMIGAFSMVRGDVPPYAVAFGIPAQVKKYRFPPEIAARLVASKWWEKDEAELRALPYDDVSTCLDKLAAQDREAQKGDQP